MSVVATNFYSIVKEQISNKEEVSGLMFTSQTDNGSDNIDIEELFSLKEAERFDASAVYFQRFYEPSKTSHSSSEFSSKPVAYIYDNTNEKFDKTQLIEIHKKLWSSGVVPIYFLVQKDSIEFFNARKPIKREKEDWLIPSLTDAIKISANIYQELQKSKLSWQFLNSGLFYEEYKGLFLEKNSPHKILLNYLKDTKSELIKSNLPFSDPYTIDKLLIKCVLIKYLESKKEVQEGQEISLPDLDTDIWQNKKSFTEIFIDGDIVLFFSKLAKKFNGKVFSWKDKETKELGQLTQEQRSLIAGYFDANINPKDRHYILWKQYSFEHLPIEFISTIYETFLPDVKTKDIAYTPPYLVDFLIDECMPLHKASSFINREFKVFDPACGSGVFLATAYKRLIEWEIINQYAKTKEWKFPELSVLQEILSQNIYGTDIKEAAADIATVSLCIAISRYLNPMTIWKSLKFRDFNIYGKDFFDFYTECKNTNQKFDLIIGNPPFKRKSRTYLDGLNQKGILFSYHIPRYEIAFMFLEKSLELVKSKEHLCLILPSKFIYTQTKPAKKLRRQVFENYFIQHVLDFTNLREILFKGSDGKKRTSVIALLIQNLRVGFNEEYIRHLVIRRTQATEQEQYIEYDYYDQFYIPYSKILDKLPLLPIKDKKSLLREYNWKANLLGGGRVHTWVEKLMLSHEGFGNYLKNKEKKQKWVICQGFKIGSLRTGIVREDHTLAPYITDKETVIAKSFTLDGYQTERLDTNTQFESPRKEKQEVYLKPHVLLRVTLDLPIHYIENDLSFPNNIVGIHAPDTEENKKELKRIVEIFHVNRELYKAFICATSSYAGVPHSYQSILKDDLDNLPFPQQNQLLKYDDFETPILQEDILTHLIRVQDAVANSKLFDTATLAHLLGYGSIFCTVLNDVHEREELKFRMGIVIETPAFFCVPFYYGYELPETSAAIVQQDDIDNELKLLIYENLGEKSKVSKLIKFYFADKENKSDVIYFIKPKALRYWLRSIALRDADESILDLFNEGY